MDLEKLAEGLIVAVDGINTEKTIEGVVEVFKGIMQGMNMQWEKHLTQQTNDILMYDKYVCPVCTHSVQIERERLVVTTKET